jgi:prevent-host-death family protein
MVDVHEAQAQFSRLLARAEAGEEIVIARAGSPVVRLVPMEQPAKRVLGRWIGQATIADDFDAELPELNRLFEEA